MSDDFETNIRTALAVMAHEVEVPDVRGATLASSKMIKQVVATALADIMSRNLLFRHCERSEATQL